jgi:hypothetical protein
MKRATLLAIALAFVPLIAHAGTTGSLTGTVVDEASRAPIENAGMSAISPTGIVQTKTDAKGNFAFVSLAPDVYVVGVSIAGYNPISVSNVTVFADQSKVLHLLGERALSRIVMVHHHDVGSLVKSGTTSNVYAYGAGSEYPVNPSFATEWFLRVTPGITFGSGPAVTQ